MGLWRYPGGKSRLAKNIVKQLSQALGDRITEYREPFVGGGSIGLALLRTHPGIERIRINDADPGVASFWATVIRWPDLIKSLIQGFTPSVAAFGEFKAGLQALDKVPTGPEDIAMVGFMKLAIHRISFSGLGVMAGGPLGGRHQLSDGSIASRWNPARLCEEVDEAHRLFSRVEVVGNVCTCQDFEEVIEEDTETALVYLDPPYYGAGPMLYQHAFTKDDHERLARLLKESKHSWLLSYDDCQAIRDLLSWANVQEIDVGYSVNGCRCARELLITRRHSTLVGVVADPLGGSFGGAVSTEVLVEATSTQAAMP